MDVISRWRDAVTDPPNNRIFVVVKSNGYIQNMLFRAQFGKWVCPDWADYDDHDIQPGDLWLDITDIPAVPRAQVQAAVDEMAIERDKGVKLSQKHIRNGHDEWAINQSSKSSAFDLAIKIVNNKTCVTPSEVQ